MPSLAIVARSLGACRLLETRDRSYVPGVSVRRHVVWIYVRMSDHTIQIIYVFFRVFLKKIKKILDQKLPFILFVPILIFFLPYS